MQTRLGCATLILAAAAIAPGCGGGGGDPLTAEQLLAQGDEICKQNQLRFSEIQSAPPNNAADAVDLTDQLIDSASEELDGLRDLTPPAELADPYSAYIDAKQEALDRLEDGNEAAKDQDAKRYADLQDQNANSVPERLRLAKAVGFKVCGRQPAL
ncbi:MAG: hypothetical protein ACXWW8_04335 [Solirubrobacterales bacterium]